MMLGPEETLHKHKNRGIFRHSRETAERGILNKDVSEKYRITN
jgi:hypothetical protein